MKILLYALGGFSVGLLFSFLFYGVLLFLAQRRH